MKDKYLSHNHITGEIYHDDFNIDYLRYFTSRDLIGSFVGSLIGAALFIYSNLILYAQIANIKWLYALFFGTGFLWFVATSIISSYAINSPTKAARIAGRRGLFTFVIMAMTAIIILFISNEITWQITINNFLKVFIGIMLTEGVFAVMLSYGISFAKRSK